MPVKRNRPQKPKKVRNGQPAPPSGGGEETSDLGTGLEDVGFVVDLFLDQNREVRLTQILHVKSNDGEAWEGWDEKQLLAFFIERAELRLAQPEVEAEAAFSETDPVAIGRGKIASSEVEPATVEEKTVLRKKVRANKAPEQPGTGAIEPAAQIGMELVVTAATEQPEAVMATKAVEQSIARGVEIISTGTPSGRVISRREPFVARLSVDPVNLIPESETELDYSVWLSALRKGQNEKYFIASRQGVVKATDHTIFVNIPQQNLEPGTYYFQADVNLSTPPLAEEGAPSMLIKSLNLRSGLLQVI